MYSSTLLTAVINNATDGHVITDQQGNIQLVNPAFSAIFGYKHGELMGANITRLIECRPARNRLHIQDDETCLIRIVGKEHELTGRKKNGSLFPFAISMSEVKDDNTVFYAVHIRDLSLEKQTQALLISEQHRNQIKTRLVSMASHEFRSPLSLIQLSTSLIERYYQRLERERVMEHLQKIKMAVSDMTDTLNDFLSLERIESGSLQPESKPFSLVSFAEELTSQMQLQAGAGQQIVHQHQGADIQVISDRNLLKHCIINLLSNAIKYSPDVSLIAFSTATKGAHFTLSVSDNGIGIPKADQKKLFQAFYRASNAMELPGTGLGLYIVKSYVKQLNGKILLKSIERRGTTFSLSFPLMTVKKARPEHLVA